MKIEKLSESRFQVYLNKFYIKEKELETDEDLEEYFKSFFLTLKNHYHISMEGFYIIQVYQDPFYGMVLQITKEDFDYFDLEVVDMRIRIKKVDFLYRFHEEDGIQKLSTFGDLYKDQDQIYLKITKPLDLYQLGMIEEFTTLIYQDTDQILKRAQYIELML